MSKDNIIKPSTLGASGNSAGASNINNSIDLTQLKEVICDIVREQCQNFNQVNSTNARTDIDQDIDPKYLANLHDLDKIPDVVKSLRDFSGQPGEFGSWKKSVDRILRIYDHLKGTPKYYGMLSVIRNKITGQADTALESYNTPLNWDKIAKCLTLHYADKRDLGTLEYQMTTLVQRHQSVPEYYQQVYQHLSLILNKLSSMEMSQESMNVMTESYRDKALDTFVRGLKGDLPRLLSMRGPTDLPEALHLCLKLDNMQYRVQHSHGNFNTRNPQSTLPPQIPPRRYTTQQRNLPIPPMRNFYPELLHGPQIPQTYQKPFPNPYPNYLTSYPIQHINRNFSNNPLPRPVPMDWQSIHSKQVNYQNRPQGFQNGPRNFPIPNKRPIQSGQTHQPAKFQRIHHYEPQDEESELTYYQDEMNEYDSQYDQSFLEYTGIQENSTRNDETEDHNCSKGQEQDGLVDDVNFLD